MRWTDALSEPLATVVRDGEWKLIAEARGGGWFLLPADPVNSHGWQHLSDDSLVLKPMMPFEDGRLKGLRATVGSHLARGNRVELLAWRVGKRAVLRVRGVDGDRIVKVYRKDRGILRRWNAFPSSHDDRWSGPRIYDWNARLRSLTLEYCRGESLNDRWLGGGSDGSDADRIIDLLQWIGSRPLDADLEPYTPLDETHTLWRRLETFERTLRTPPPRARRLAEVVSRRLLDDDTQPALCHRDLHDKQILLEQGRGRLIDLDLAANAPPALDVGNILGHIHLRWLKGAGIPWEDWVGRIATAALEDRDLRRSLPVWTASTLLRLSLIYSRRRRDPELLDQLMDAVESALAARGPWSCLR